MKGYVSNIERSALENANFRKVLYTTPASQLVLMSIPEGSDIGEEVHDVDQFLRIEAGTGVAVIDGVEHEVEDGSAIVIPAGARHNVTNVGDAPLKLYSIYMPPHHKDGTVHPTKEDAEVDEEHFDGKTSE